MAIRPTCKPNAVALAPRVQTLTNQGIHGSIIGLPYGNVTTVVLYLHVVSIFTSICVMPSIRDVARQAGVAPITVSRVMDNSANVSAETREQVEKVIEELGVVPNRLARSLRLKRTHTLALIVTDITYPFWTTVVRGVQDAAQDAGFTVILCNTDESEDKQEQHLDILLQERVDGILLAPARDSAELVDWIQRQTKPLVVLDRRVGSAQVDVVHSDSTDGAYQLVLHLLSLGHRRAAVLSGPRDVSTAIDRVAGYCRALTEAGLQVPADWVRYRRFSQESGYEMAQQVHATSPRPTALSAVNDFIAIGALRAPGYWPAGTRRRVCGGL